MEAKTGRPGQRGKGIEEVVQYALGHRIRVQILLVLNQGTYTVGQLAEIIGEPTNNVGNHVRELLDAGSIELSESVQRGNIVLNYYRAVEIPYFSQKDAEAMTHEERQVTAGLMVQSGMAEVLAALWAGHLADPRTCIAWDWFNVDEQGRQELEDEQKRTWDRYREIEVAASNRRAISGEDAVPMLMCEFGFLRARKAPGFPAPT